MSWDAIGAIGEIVGAAAVVVSIAYLAVQVRQNTKTIAANTAQAASGAAVDMIMRTAENAELSAIIAKVLEGRDDLSTQEQIQFQLLLRGNFRNYENYFYQYRRGYFEKEIWEGYQRVISDQLSLKNGREWWERNRDIFGASFVAFIDSEIANLQAPRRFIVNDTSD